jgi:cytochrome d ubiquinol oxidase subunit II
VHLHVPLVLMLVGIVLRGCAFTFRHYDPIKDRSESFYTALFIFGSVLTPLCFGLIIGAITAGRIDPQAQDAYALYVAPWLHPFGLLLGLFCLTLCIFLASAYLVGETQDAELQALFVRRTLYSNVALVVCGGLVLLTAQRYGVFTLRGFLLRPQSGGSFVLATVLLAPLWLALMNKRVWASRLLAAALVCLVIAGWLFTMQPFLVKTRQGGIDVASVIAPDATLRQLALALCLGLCLVIPALIYLLRIFKGAQESR